MLISPGEEKEGEIPGYISGMLLEEGHFDEMLGVPDHPRFKDKVEEKEEEIVDKPGSVFDHVSWI